MRYTLIMMLFGCLVAQTFTRPATMDEAGDSEGDEAEYAGDNEGSEADESMQDEDESRLSEQDAAAEDQEEEPAQNRNFREPNAYSQKSSRDDEQNNGDTGDSFAGVKTNRNSDSYEEPVDESNSNNEYQAPTKLQESAKFIEKGDEVNDQTDGLQHLANRENNDAKSLRSDMNAINKRNPISRNVANEEGDLLFESSDANRDQREKTDKGEYNNESSDASEQSQYSKKLYNTMQEGVPDEKRFDNHYNLNRDRRALQETNDTSANLNNNNPELETDDEEAAIKRHVNKLSGEELDDLLNSLTEDKRELLKKIMESDTGNDNEINKREITKKAGAAPDENGYLESGQSDTSKLQEGSPGSDSNAPAQSSTEHSKLPNPQSDINVLPVTKTLEVSNGSSSTIINTDNKAELTVSRNPDSNSGKSEGAANTLAPLLDSNNPAKINSNPQEKTETKREANMKDLSFEAPYEDSKSFESNFNFKDSQGFARDSGYFCSPDEDTRIIDDEHVNNNINKREVLNDKDADISDSMKSLEDSFPNSNSYDDDDPYSGTDMAPLVRVKRKNLDTNVKKRAAGILPDAKVAYFPYRAENDDEDNDEGNEFDDDGFYDRTSNLAKSNVKDTSSEEETPTNFEESAQQSRSNNKNSPSNLINRSKLASNIKMESDPMSLGSDTDSVLSGVEGVDDNLMFNSGTRNRRTAEAFMNDRAADNAEGKLNRPVRSTPLTEDKLKSASENYINVPNYHENDAFGPLPRSYEGELGRYKRIRRVKQPPSSQDIASDA